MIDIDLEQLPTAAAAFRERVADQDWAESDSRLVEAIRTADDTVVGILGRMSACHGTLPSLAGGVQEHGLRGDYTVLEPETVEIFRSLLKEHIDFKRPDIEQSLRLHYFRPEQPVYIATSKSVASVYGFPESSRFILQGLVHVSRWPETPKAEAEHLETVVNNELDKLLSDDGDRNTAVVSLDVACPSILRSLASPEDIAKLSGFATMLEPRMLAAALAEGNLPVAGHVSPAHVTGVEIVASDFSWHDTILSGKGQSVFAAASNRR